MRMLLKRFEMKRTNDTAERNKDIIRKRICNRIMKSNTGIYQKRKCHSILE